MKNLLSVLTIGTIAVFALGCKSNKDTTSAKAETSTKTEVQTEPQILASIQRTACYGQCPMYKATFMDNGEVKYVGKRFVEKIGTYRTLISAEEVLLIKENIQQLGYFQLDSLYPTPIADFPSCITEASLNGKKKKIVDRQDAPRNLKAFEKFLDSLLEGKELEKASDDTSYDQEAK